MIALLLIPSCSPYCLVNHEIWCNFCVENLWWRLIRFLPRSVLSASTEPVSSLRNFKRFPSFMRLKFPQCNPQHEHQCTVCSPQTTVSGRERPNQIWASFRCLWRKHQIGHFGMRPIMRRIWHATSSLVTDEAGFRHVALNAQWEALTSL